LPPVKKNNRQPLNNEESKRNARKNRTIALTISLVMAAAFIYPTWTSAKNVVIDGSIQWVSLGITCFFGIWLIFPILVLLFYDGNEDNNPQHPLSGSVRRRFKWAATVFLGILSLAFSLFAFHYWMHPHTVSADELRRLDGTLCNISPYNGNVKGNNRHTGVQLCELPDVEFRIPYYDTLLPEGGKVSLLIMEKDYLRVTGTLPATRGERHTLDQYHPTVYAYKTDTYFMPLSAYNDMKETGRGWGLAAGLIVLAIGLLGETAIWANELYRYAETHQLHLLQRIAKLMMKRRN